MKEKEIKRNCGTCHYNKNGYCTAKGERTSKDECGWHCTHAEYKEQSKKAEQRRKEKENNEPRNM